MTREELLLAKEEAAAAAALDDLAAVEVEEADAACVCSPSVGSYPAGGSYPEMRSPARDLSVSLTAERALFTSAFTPT